MVVLVVFIASVVGVSAYNSSRSQADFNKILSAYDEYSGITQQFSSLPSSTTKTKSEWDSYYDNLISQVNGVQIKSTNLSVSDAHLAILNLDFQNAMKDFVNLMTLEKSNNDLQFQIDNDKTIVNSDQANVQSDIALDNTDCNLSVSNPYITCDRSLENGAKAQLITDQTQLDKDNKANQDQLTELANLGQTLKTANSKFNTDLGFK